jgi:Zn-dependent M28 family amino/carboxypeptidase
LWPRNHIVGVINLDDGGPQPRSRDLQASGPASRKLEDVLRQALATQHRVLSPDSEPEKGLFFRSDHFRPCQAGIPAISPGGATIFW